jgi:hypothetical protein
MYIGLQENIPKKIISSNVWLVGHGDEAVIIIKYHNITLPEAKNLVTLSLYNKLPFTAQLLYSGDFSYKLLSDVAPYEIYVAPLK